MDYQLWVDQCQALLNRYHLQIGQLQSALADEDGYAFFMEEGSPSLDGQDARDAIIAHIGQSNYTGSEKALTGITLPHRYMAAACSSPLLELIAGLGGINHTKACFQRFHEDLRSKFNSQVEATRVLRDVLTLCKSKLLNVEAVDRHLPLLDGAVRKISWYENHSAPSARRTVLDAEQTLLVKLERAGEERAAELTKEIAHLRTLPADLKVAQRLRKPITSLKMRILGVDSAGDRRTLTDYAKNPLFFLDTGFTPSLVFPDPDAPEGNRGRPTKISEKRVSPSLHNWFFYKDSAKHKVVTAKPRNTTNSDAKTGCPGIWFYTNPSGTFCFRYRLPSGNVSSVVIKKNSGGYDLEGSWSAVIKRAWPEKTGVDRDRLMALCPSQDHLERYIAKQSSTGH